MSSGKNIYYLDYAATTPVDAEVIASALPYFGSSFHNPASAHLLGQMASMAVEHARSQCLSAINGKGAGNVYFTSGGTEAINWAIKCVRIPQGSRIVVSALEHDAVTACAERMKQRGYEVVTVMPTKDGIITPEALESVIDDNTSLVCVMTVNNIVGTVQPIKELTEVAHSHGALMFTDAVQAVNSVPLDVSDTGVDMLCVSGHKFYAPKGSGFLYVRSGVGLDPLLDGGSQENGYRAGTVDVPAAVALGTAITRAAQNTELYRRTAKAAADAFLSALDCGSPILPGVPRADDILSVVFDGVNGGRLAVALSVAGVCCSVGSACSAGSATPPPALLAMGIENADCAVRFSFGKNTTPQSATAAALIVNETVAKLINSKL